MIRLGTHSPFNLIHTVSSTKFLNSIPDLSDASIPIAARDQSMESDVDWKVEYPFQSHYINVGNHRQHYVDESPQNSGSPVLMVHGNPTWSFYYRRLISDLRARHRVVAVDHLGCGLSDKPIDFDYCLQSHIDNLTRLVDTLDLSNITLLAHDWGGAIGLGALLARRERFKRIILFNTGAFPPPFIPFRIRVCRWPVVGKIGVQGFNVFARAATVMATERKGGLLPGVAKGLLFPYSNWNNRIAIYKFVKDIPLSKRHRTWKTLDEIERGLKQVADWPIMLMWGMKDWCFRPECLRRFQAHWPGAIVHEIEDAGHYVVEDAHRQVAERVREFLEKQ